MAEHEDAPTVGIYLQTISIPTPHIIIDDDSDLNWSLLQMNP